MGKITGFMESPRQKERYAPVEQRVKHYKEFTIGFEGKEALTQAGRCMDCGIPFCHNGCPIHNLIPDFNDLVYQDDWKAALERLHHTNNFPEFTGRVCPAPCEAACTLNIGHEAVRIKGIEQAIIDRGWEEGWIVPQPAKQQTGKTIAIVGSGPAGLAAAQQLARLGHTVTVYEKNDRIGGLLRYGIPDFKLEKLHIDRRIQQMEAEGVVFKTGIWIGTGHYSYQYLIDSYDAILLAGGAEQARDLPLEGRSLAGVHFAMTFLSQQNKRTAGDALQGDIPILSAKDKDVIVIGGGDTGSDCVGTSRRQGAKSITQFELLAMPPEQENKALTWPYWPLKLRHSTSHEEGCTREFAIATQCFTGEHGKVTGIQCVHVEWINGQMHPIAGGERFFPADLVLLAMGFTGPSKETLEHFSLLPNERGLPHAMDASCLYQTPQEKVFAAGDMRRGQSLVVWAINEGRQAAQAIHTFLKQAG